MKRQKQDNEQELFLELNWIKKLAGANKAI